MLALPYQESFEPSLFDFKIYLEKKSLLISNTNILCQYFQQT